MTDETVSKLLNEALKVTEEEEAYRKRLEQILLAIHCILEAFPESPKDMQMLDIGISMIGVQVQKEIAHKGKDPIVTAMWMARYTSEYIFASAGTSRQAVAQYIIDKGGANKIEEAIRATAAEKKPWSKPDVKEDTSGSGSPDVVDRREDRPEDPPSVQPGTHEAPKL